jgi:hypothetical protein
MIVAAALAFALGAASYAAWRRRDPGFAWDWLRSRRASRFALRRLLSRQAVDWGQSLLQDDVPRAALVWASRALSLDSDDACAATLKAQVLLVLDRPRAALRILRPLHRRLRCEGRPQEVGLVAYVAVIGAQACIRMKQRARTSRDEAAWHQEALDCLAPALAESPDEVLLDVRMDPVLADLRDEVEGRYGCLEFGGAEDEAASRHLAQQVKRAGLEATT